MVEQSGTMMTVQVCHAESTQRILLELQVPLGCTLRQAILASGILQQLPDLVLDQIQVGVFGKIKSLNSLLHPHDRIELYRPLRADPKDARRQRAQHANGHHE
ncbi:MAG: RnfH family protein [Herbaspirillum sp.]